MKPDDTGYTYDGIANVCARPAIRLRPARILCNAELRGSIRGATLVGASKCARIRATVREGGGSALLRPVDHSGVAVDFYGPTSLPTKAGAEDLDIPIAEEKRDMSKTEAMRLYRDAFQPREAHARNIRDAIHTLGVGIADAASMQNIFALFRQLFPNRDSWGKRTANRLRCALAHLRLQKSGRGSDLAQRLLNTFSPVDNTEMAPLPQPNHIDECIAADKKPRREILDPAIHDGRRVAGPADEVGANYRIIYDDELEEGDFADDSNDFQAERDSIAAAGLRASSSDYFPKFDDIPNSLSRPDISGLANPVRIWGKGRPLSMRIHLFSTQHNGLSTTVYANGPQTCRNLYISGARPNFASRYSGRRGRGKRRS